MLYKNTDYQFSDVLSNSTNRDYRKQYINDLGNTRDQLDKMLITLSAGAFGVTFAFTNNFIDGATEFPSILIMSWMLWAATITSSLCSFHFSCKAYETAISQLDAGTNFDNEQIGGKYSLWVNGLNILSLICFVLAFAAITIFILLNI